MIFTTKNNELAILGNTFDDVKGKISNFTTVWEQYGLKGENGALSYLLSKNNKSVITPELLSDFETFKQRFNSSSLSAEAVAEELDGVDERIVSYAKTCKNGELTTNGFTSSLEGMTLGAQAATVAMKAVSIAGNMLLMWAATQLITVFVKFIDSLHTTLAEQQEITKNLQSELSDIQSGIEDVNSELETIGDRIDELNAKDSLSFVEKEELENLKEENDELQRRKNLLKEQETKKQQEVADSVKKEYDKKYGDNYYQSMVGVNDIEDKRNRQAELDARYDLTLDEYEELQKLNAEIITWDSNVRETTSFPEHIYETINAYNELNQKKKEGKELSEEEQRQLEEWRNELVDTAVGLNDYVDSYGIEDETSQSWHNLSVSISECLYPADVQTEKFNEVFNGLSNNIQNELIALAQNGTLSVDDLSERIKEKFEEAGFTANEVIEQIKSGIEDLPVKSPLSYPTILSQIQSLSSALDQLDQIYTDIYDKEDFDWSSILNNNDFTEAFGEMGESYDNFIKTVSEAPGDLDKCQSAFDDLLTSYLYSSEDSDGYSIMSNLTEETKQATVAMLSQMGVANALEVVEYQLAKNTGYLTDAQAEQAAICKQLSQEAETLADKTSLNTLESTDLERASYAEIQALIDEANTLGITSDALVSFKLNKMDIDNTPINTSEDIDNLLTMANAAGVATKAVGQLAALKAAYDKAVKDMENGVAGAGYKVSGIAAQMQKAAEEAQNDVINFKPAVTYGGGSNYKSAINQAAKDSSASAESEFSETIDFFERRIEVLDTSLDLLSASLENVTGSFAKNSIIDGQLSINKEKIQNYTDALAMYTGEANKILSTIPSDIAQKVKNGAVSLTDFVGDGNEAVVEAIGDYEAWADKISDCNQQLTSLKQTIAQLELDKFNNIAQDFDDQNDLRNSAISNIDKQIALLEEMGELVGVSYYEAQKSLAEKQLGTLTGENGKRNTLAAALAEALASGNVQVSSDEWLSMVKALSEVDGEIIDCQTAIEKYDNAILQLNWDTFDRQQEAISNVQSELSNLVDLFDDIDAADDSTGEWTADALAKLGLLAQQYEAAQVSVSDYDKAITALKQNYADGKYSATEYAEKLAELSEGQWKAVKATESAKDAIVELNEARINEVIEGIEKEKDAYKELVDAQIDALDAEKNLHDYKKSISEKTKNVTDLEQQIAAMRNDTSAAGIAKRKKLEAQLAEAKEELEEAEYEHSIDTQKEALNQQYEDFKAEKDKDIDALKETLNDIEKLIADSLDAVKQNAALVGEQITNAAKEHGITVSESVVSPWKNGEGAIAGYGETLSFSTSVFVGNLGAIKTETENLQKQADNASHSYASIFSQKSDDLVTHLTNAYTSTENLYNMASSLNAAFKTALESGYDVSTLTNALNSVKQSAEAASNAISKVSGSSGSNGTTTSDTTSTTTAITTYKILDSNGNSVDGVTYTSADAATKKLSEYRGGTGKNSTTAGYHIMKYANGTRSTNGELIVKDEKGYELGLPKLSSGNYALMPEGSQILTKAQTDNLFEWAKMNPVSIIPDISLPTIPKIATRNVNQPVTIQSNITFTGAVNDADSFAKDIAKIADKQVEKSWRKATDSLRY